MDSQKGAYTPCKKRDMILRRTDMHRSASQTAYLGEAARAKAAPSSKGISKQTQNSAHIVSWNFGVSSFDIISLLAFRCFLQIAEFPTITKSFVAHRKSCHIFLSPFDVSLRCQLPWIVDILNSRAIR
jgi:hypothetical protein